MKKVILLILLLPNSLMLNAKDRSPEGGHLSVGMRQTLSLFSDQGFTGYGTGGQFRIRLGERLNTEWFADYITTPYANLGKRVDGHIGWSVMFYPFPTLEKKFVPYLIAGHCFDYTKITPFNTLVDLRTDNAKSRWSSATQAGLGLHYFLNDKFDITLTSQFMMHLGNELETDIINLNGTEYLVVKDHDHSRRQTLEGHLLLTLSVNYRIADLWK